MSKKNRSEVIFYKKMFLFITFFIVLTIFDSFLAYLPYFLIMKTFKYDFFYKIVCNLDFIEPFGQKKTINVKKPFGPIA